MFMVTSQYQMSLGYIRDTTSHSVISSLGVYDPKDTARDPIRAVVWQPGAHRTEVIEYDGKLSAHLRRDII